MKKILLTLGLLSTFAFSKDCIDYYLESELSIASTCYKQLTLKNNTANNNFYTATILVEEGKYKESIPYLKTAELLSNNNEQLALIYNRFSISYNNLNQLDLSL